MELLPSAVRKTIPIPLKSSHQTKHFCWAVSGILGLVEALQEQGRLMEALAVLHSAIKDVLCSTSEGSAGGCFSDGATLSSPERANLILCEQHHPLDYPVRLWGWFAVSSHSEEQAQWVLYPG